MIHRLSAALALALLAIEAQAVALRENQLAQTNAMDEQDDVVDLVTTNDGTGEEGAGEGEADSGETEADAGEEEAAAEEPAAEAEEPKQKGNNVQVKIDFNVDVKHPHHDHHEEITGREQAIVDALAAAQEALGAAEAGLDSAADAVEADGAAATGDADADADAGAGEAATGTTSHVHLTLSDDTMVGGVTWADLKVTAFSEGYKESTDYTDLSAQDQAIVNALIDAQTALGAGEETSELVAGTEVEIEYTEPAPAEEVAEETPADSTLTVELKDDNEIAGMTWADWKTAGSMDFGFEQTAAFTDLSNLDQALLMAHQAAQFATNDNDGILEATLSSVTWSDVDSNAPGVTSVCTVLNDQTSVGGTAWVFLKETAMSAEYTNSAAYTELSDVEKAVVDQLIINQGMEDAFDSPLSETSDTLALYII